MVYLSPVVLTILDFHSTKKKKAHRYLVEDHQGNIPAKFAFKLFVSLRENNLKQFFFIGSDVNFVLRWWPPWISDPHEK